MYRYIDKFKSMLLSLARTRRRTRYN